MTTSHKATNSPSTGPLLRRVRIRDYKSIGKCDVALDPLTLLVGRNGAGKSNFLDALSFVTDSLQNSLDHAVRDRGGVEAVRRCSTGHPLSFALEVEISLPGSKLARYGFEIAAAAKSGFVVNREQLTVRKTGGEIAASFCRRIGEVKEASLDNVPPVQAGRLYLANLAGFPECREVFQALTSVGFYTLNPDHMKELQSPDAGYLLNRDGSNIASVIGRLQEDRPDIMDRITSYLQRIVPEMTSVERIALGPRETLQFRQHVEGAKYPWKFFAAHMSDGTLHALGVLAAVSQLLDRRRPVNVVGIEEPETALHPAAAGTLMDALREASVHTQILVTTHSPDLLNQIVPEQDRFLVVTYRGGRTQITSADKASLDAIQQHLFEPGELLRMDQLDPDAEELKRQDQLVLFNHPVATA